MCCACGGGWEYTKVSNTVKSVVLYGSEVQITAEKSCRNRVTDLAFQPFCFPEEDGSGTEPFVVGHWQHPQNPLDDATFVQRLADLPRSGNYSIGGTFAAPPPRLRRFEDAE
mmetsp:Transcript_149538/g.480003  ORF Transcript_149538/g.480003 Transcript_149538/m.480003 type:complete len:112 (+) Transcript_149538:1-336(+)